MPSSRPLSSLHISILAEESFNMLTIPQSSRHIDATLGMGGHCEFFLSRNEKLQVKGFDQDPFARKVASERLAEYDDRFEIIPENFEKIGSLADFSPTSILFDIGVSSVQFDDGERGFSFRSDATLDMRMNPENQLTAKEIINTWSQEELLRIFSEYGEEKHAYMLSKKIVEEREKQLFETTVQLASFIEQVKPWKKQSWKKGKGTKKEAGGHAATLVFQALRIAVNRELEVLESALHQAVKMLEVGGRIAVISFHSLEDRIVKKCFDSYVSKEKVNKYKITEEESKREASQLCLVKISKKPVVPSDQEQIDNPRSRSAKMRVVEKICECI